MGGCRMRRMLVLLALVVGAFASTTGPAGAITGNYVEDFEHPFVGLVAFYDAEGEFSHRCSGSLISPSVFLTAGHCTEGATTARIWFHQGAGSNYDPATQLDPVTGYPEKCITGDPLCYTSDELYNYGFDDFAGFPQTRDAGLVILDQAVPTSVISEYGVLATAGSLDRIASKGPGRHGVEFTASGYGLTKSSPVRVESYRERLMATARLTNLNNALTSGFNLQTNGNGSGRGGTCSGDSGGPVFYGGTSSNIIVAVTSFGLNAYCRGVDFAYRTDQVDVIAWILEHAPDSEEAGIIARMVSLP
jgi:hypothetical protein